MQSESTSETSANVSQTTRRNNPEDSHLHTRRRENLKFHFVKVNLDFLIRSNNFGCLTHLRRVGTRLAQYYRLARLGAILQCVITVRPTHED
jgi:hypothetical protein